MHSSLLLFLVICLLPACLITIWRARQKRKPKDYEREEVSPTKPEPHTPTSQTYDQPQFLQTVRFSHESYPLIYVPQSGTAPQRPRLRKREHPQTKEVSPTKPEPHTSTSQTYDQPQFLQAVRFSHESYPLIYVPQSGTAPQRPRFRKREYPQGITEQTLKRALYRHLVTHRSGLLRRFTYSQISSNAYIPTSSTARAYEPDITIIAELGDQRLLLDIEIDEPYVGSTGEPTHYIQGRDADRDMHLISLGWLVLRFSEMQVHHNLKGCVQEVERILRLIFIGEDVPTEFTGGKRTYRWTRERASTWAEEKYREQYLQVTFSSPKSPTSSEETSDPIDESIPISEMENTPLSQSTSSLSEEAF